MVEFHAEEQGCSKLVRLISEGPGSRIHPQHAQIPSPELDKVVVDADFAVVVVSGAVAATAATTLLLSILS